MDKEQIKKLAADRGFIEFATIKTPKTCKIQFLDRVGINLIVNVDNKEFELVYNVPHSIFSLSCPTCSPFDNDEHFNRLYKKFRRIVIYKGWEV